MVSFLFGYFIVKNYKEKIIVSVLFFLLFLFSSTYIYANVLYGRQQNIINRNFSNDVEIINENNETFKLENKKRKVLVLDLWSTSCLSCFKKFPEFEKQYKKYKSDTLVEFYTLNLPLKNDSPKTVKNLIKKYNFPKLYANKMESWKQLNVTSVPLFFIIDKKGEIRFKGSINTSKFLFYNNLNSLIEKLKNE